MLLDVGAMDLEIEGRKVNGTESALEVIKLEALKALLVVEAVVTGLELLEVTATTLYDVLIVLRPDA